MGLVEALSFFQAKEHEYDAEASSQRLASKIYFWFSHLGVLAIMLVTENDLSANLHKVNGWHTLGPYLVLGCTCVVLYVMTDCDPGFIPKGDGNVELGPVDPEVLPAPLKASLHGRHGSGESDRKIPEDADGSGSGGDGASPLIDGRERPSGERMHNKRRSRRRSEALPQASPSRRYCGECDITLPLRAKHCDICKRCVRRYDHHCPMIGTCVGENNHRCFVLLLSAETVLCAWTFHNALSGIKPMGSWDAYFMYNAPMFAVIMAVGLFGLLPECLCAFHCFLAFLNLSTWEATKSESISYLDGYSHNNPFHRGCWGNIKWFFCADSCRRERQYVDWQPRPEQYALALKMRDLSSVSVWDNPYHNRHYSCC